MNSKFPHYVLLCVVTLSLLSFELPKSWFKAGSDPDKYDFTLEKGAGQDGSNAASLKSNATGIKGFGTLMQSCSPGKYSGKRVRMTGYLKSKDLESSAAFWMRVDAQDSKQPLAFDNMNDRSVKGTTDWKKYEIVLDVPENAAKLAYGVLIQGMGQVWIDNVAFEIVDSSVPTTGALLEKTKERSAQTEPANLNFED